MSTRPDHVRVRNAYLIPAPEEVFGSETSTTTLANEGTYRALRLLITSITIDTPTDHLDGTVEAAEAFQRTCMAMFASRLQQTPGSMQEMWQIMRRPIELQSTSQQEWLEAKIRSLVEEGKIAEARRVLCLHWPSPPLLPTPSLQEWCALLSPPRVLNKKAGSARGLAENAAWLRRNARAYAGNWVAVLNGEFLDSDPSRKALVGRVRDRSASQDVLIHHCG